MPSLSQAEAAAWIAARRRVFVTVVRRAGVPEADVDDVTQEVMVRLLRCWSKWDPARSSFVTFLDKTAERTARWWLAKRKPAAVPFNERRHRPATRGERLAPTPLGGAAVAMLDTLPLGGAAVAMLDTLPPGHRRLVELLLSGLTLDQAATQLGHEPHQARITLGHALSKLAAAGLVPADLATAHGLDAATLAKKGDFRTSRAAVPTRRAKVADLRAADRTPKQIANDLAVPLPTIRDDIRALTRPRTLTPGRVRIAAQKAARAAKRADRLRYLAEVVRPRRERLAALVATGMSFSAAARELGLTAGTTESDRAALRRAG